MSLKLTSYKGTRDLYPEDMAERRYIFDNWRRVVECYGYKEYMAPMLEPVEVYAAKSGEEIVNEQTYSFTDRGGRQMVIRPEMTPSIARMVAARRQETPMPARFYSIANFMRYERPQHGREREFWQLNFDLFGIDNIEADKEIIRMSHDLITEFDASEDMFTIKVNDRRLTDYIMHDYLKLDDEQSHRMIKLLDKYDKMPREKFDELTLETVGKDNAGRLNEIISAQSIDDLPAEVLAGGATEELEQIIDDLQDEGIFNIRYDVRLMRGFDYYTGVVFEVFDEAPENRRAMFGGGRYDGLISLFGVESLPVVGAAPGETMFREFLLAHSLMPDLSDDVATDIVLLPMERDEDILEMTEDCARDLRETGYRVAVDYTDRKLDKRIKAADKQGVKLVGIIGDDEVTNDVVMLKDLTTGEQQAVDVDELSDAVDEFYDEYYDERFKLEFNFSDDDDNGNDEEFNCD